MLNQHTKNELLCNREECNNKKQQQQHTGQLIIMDRIEIALHCWRTFLHKAVFIINADVNWTKMSKQTLGVLCIVQCTLFYHLFVAVVCMHIHIALVYMLCVYIAPYISNRRTNKNINSDKNNEFLAYFHDSSSNTNDQFCNENIFFRSHFRGNIPYSLE